MSTTKIHLFDTMAREIGPKRTWVEDKNKFFHWLNTNRTYEDCRVSVYRYGNRLQEKNYGDADPRSVVVDKIFIDTDSFYGYEVMKLLNEKLCDLGFVHRINYSGRYTPYGTIPRAIGFHIYVFCYPNINYPKQALSNAQIFMDKWVRKKAKVEFGITEDDAVDSAIIGDVMRMSRYPNTFNKKWKRWCVPLTQEDIDNLNPYDIYKLGSQPRREVNGNVWLGEGKIWQLPPKFDKDEFDKFKRRNVNVTKSECDWAEMMEVYDAPPCLWSMLNDPHLDYQERFWLIVCLRDLGFTQEETETILDDSLDYYKFMHCVNQELMTHRCYNGEQQSAYFTDGCAFMKSRGYCPGNCGRDHPIYK